MRARCAIAFDLDGVLWRSPNVFPFSKPTLNKVIEKQIPFVFLTNSGGYPERIKMQHINQQLKMEIDYSHLILSHTPLKQHLNHIKNDCILVSGNRDIYDVAIEYGFNNAISAGEIISAHPYTFPFPSSHKQIELDESRKNNPNILEFDPTNISAVAILNDGHCWGSELQIMIDALIYGKKVNGNDHPLFYYTNADLLWTTQYKYPRFAQGIYVGIVEDTFKRLTGKELNGIQFGKPAIETFNYAENVLINEANKLGYNDIDEVYMIGDNPDGDIIGGNNKGWKTILVKSGVYQDGKMDPQNPFIIHENAQEAVDWIIDQHSL
eukprot:401805_1